MEDNNRFLIYETLKKVYPVSTAMVSMWLKDKPYHRMLFLRFRFGKLEKNDPIYGRLEKVITDFKGELNWALFKSESTDNYLLVPSIFLEFRERYGTWEASEMIDFFGIAWFKSIIDKGM